MPRPKRSKVAPSAPAPRVAKSTKPAVDPGPEPPAPEISFNDMYDVSDPDAGVTTSVRLVEKNNGKGKAAAARGRSSVTRPNARDMGRGHSLSEPGEKRLDKGYPDAENQSGNLGTEDVDLQSSSPTGEVGWRERSTPGVENSILALRNFRRRPRQQSILGYAAARARSSSVESNLAQDNGLTSVGSRNNSALGNRHSREPSVRGRSAGHLRSSSIGPGKGTPTYGGSIINLANFKKRVRQPSILGTAQKNRQQRLEYDEDEDEDDFSPEDESTPLKLAKANDIASSSSASISKKRKLSAVQGLQSSPPIPSDGETHEQENLPAYRPSKVEAEAEADERESSEEAPRPSIEPEEANPEPMSETMAPPLSSSPTAESPPSYRAAQRLRAERQTSQSARVRRRLRDRTPPPATQESSISSPPSLTHSPNFPAAKAAPKTHPTAKRRAPPPSTFSTAQLQALLPQRRRRRGARDPFDIASSEDEIDVSGLASDDDELTHLSIRAAPRRRVLPRVPPLGKMSRKSKALPAPKPGRKQLHGNLTALTTSDKENEEVDPDDSLAPLPDDEAVEGSPENSQELEKRIGKELKLAARKFEEVDKWELEFEECTASSSSPKDAR